MKLTRYNLIPLILLAVLLGMASICLAQGGTWTTKADMPTSRYAHKTCVVNGKIYAIGGASGIGCNSFAFQTVEEYNPSTDSWSTKTDMPTARESFSLSAVNGKIYAIGGHSRTCAGRLSTVEVYNPRTDTWSTKSRMPTPRGGLSSSVVNGKIYAMGGLRGSNNAFATVEEYDPVTDSWTAKTDMPTARRFFSTSVVDGKIYVFWGYYGTNVTTIDVYDPVNDIWITKDAPVAYGDCSASTVNGLIYIFGGRLFFGGESMADVWEYNPVSDTWLSMSPMLTARAGAPASAVNGKIYIIGNSTTLWPYRSTATVEEYTPSGVTSVKNIFEDMNTPTEFVLQQNYPNPFNPETRISYKISQQTRVVLKVINLLGQEIRTLVQEEKPGGFYEVTWDGKDATGQKIASGVYVYRLEMQGFAQSRKMVLLQ